MTKKKSKAGRPTLLRPELADAIVRAVRGGLTPSVAARSLGVDRHTFGRWRRLGKAGKGNRLFRTLCTKIDQAQADALKRFVFLISKGAEENTEDAKWLLTKLAPKTYGNSREADAFRKENETLRRRIAELESTGRGTSGPRVKISLHHEVVARVDGGGAVDFDVLIDDDDLDETEREKEDF